ncbi:hypothetical protein NDU88_005722 [Pleurodeles waltl]|uniref:Uncharacterized protein n=1 Tax=Pleurodeles waltl TaxID=8319 RepID=A0AAV7MX49_PLEWA|nr:hypothetical protein NDU88_005722 [Pleurodeles waltl]
MLLVIILLLCCGFAGILEQSEVDPWQKSKREMLRNSGELLHSLSDEKPTGETLNSPQKRIGHLTRGKIPSTHWRFLQSSWCKKEAGYPQSMHHQETGEKAGRMKRYKVAVVIFATLLWFCRRPEQSAVDPLAEGEERNAEELW